MISTETHTRESKIGSPVISPVALQNIQRTYLAFTYFYGDRDGWDEERQSGNFDLAMKLVDHAGGRPCMYSCMDMGCGSGKFAQVWKANGGKAYTGVDVMGIREEDPLYEIVTSTPGFSFVQGEFTRLPLEEHDFVIASGSLSVGEPSAKYVQLERYLYRMAELSKRGFYFNFWEENGKAHTMPFLDYKTPQVESLIAQIQAELGFNTVHWDVETMTSGPAAGDHQNHVWVLR